MLTVVAPASIAASSSRQRKSGSERPASSGENSTLSVYSRAQRTAFTAWSSTCSGVIRSFICMWIGELVPPDGALGGRPGDVVHGGEIAVRRCREARLDDVDAQPLELPRDARL